MRTQPKGWIYRVCGEWSEKLPLGSAGGAESVRPDWTAVPESERTMLTQSRLAYTLIHAGAGTEEGAKADGAWTEYGRAGEKAAGNAADRVQRHFWKPSSRGWIRAVTLEGAPADVTIDTYDQAFGLLMLAWDFLTAGTEDAKARETALLALAGLDEECSGPGGGYLERREGTRGSRLVQYPELRRQNPHMHLLEAFLAWHRADPSGPWLEKARAMVELLRRRFRPTGNLAEFFDAEWNPAPGEPGRIREPGHHYEWVWLLRRWFEASGEEAARADAEFLYRFAVERGTDTDGLAFAAVDDAGKILGGEKPLWPQTEMLKAHLAMFEWTGDQGAKAAAEKALAAIRSRYMRADGALFYNQLDRAGRPSPAPSLSRLLYHLFVAAAEAERVLGPAQGRGAGDGGGISRS